MNSYHGWYKFYMTYFSKDVYNIFRESRKLWRKHLQIVHHCWVILTKTNFSSDNFRLHQSVLLKTIFSGFFLKRFFIIIYLVLTLLQVNLIYIDLKIHNLSYNTM